MKSSAPDETCSPLGAPIRHTPAEAKPTTKAHNASGTIQVDGDGRLSTNIPTPPPQYTWAPYVPPVPASTPSVPWGTDDLQAYFLAISNALTLRLGDTDFPIDEYGV